MKTVTIVGVGMSPRTLTQSGLFAIHSAEVLFGAPRLLEAFARPGQETYPVYTARKIVPVLAESHHASFVVLVSGDTGFYSAATALARDLTGAEVRMEPGISSVNYFFAKLGRPWQGAALVSCHGRQSNLVEYVRRSAATFALTGGNTAQLAHDLCDAGFGGLTVHVGSRLGMEGETVFSCSVSALAETTVDPLTVLLIDNPAPDDRCPAGIDDNTFIRGDVPMTKSAVRAVTMSKLKLRSDAVCCDVGAGTGSVTVEMALSAWRGHVYAIDKNAEAVALVRHNCAKFHIGNVTALQGDALETLRTLPAMDAVFIGGSGGEMDQLIAAALEKNPNVRIVVNAIALETLQAAMDAFTARGLAAEIVQLSCAESRNVGKLHMMTAQNPIFIISGGGADV